MNFKTNTWIKWTSTDEDGTFSHTGQITGSTKTSVTLQTAEGSITIDKSDGTFADARKPKGSKAVTAAATPAPAAAPAGLRPVEELSDKMRSCIDLIRSASVTTRKELIQVLVTGLDMSAASASTFYNTAKRYV